MSEFIQWSFKKIETMRNQSTYIGYTKNYGIKTNSISKYLQISRKKISLFSYCLKMGTQAGTKQWKLAYISAVLLEKVRWHPQLQVAHFFHVCPAVDQHQGTDPQL